MTWGSCFLHQWRWPTTRIRGCVCHAGKLNIHVRDGLLQNQGCRRLPSCGGTSWLPGAGSREPEFQHSRCPWRRGWRCQEVKGEESGKWGWSGNHVLPDKLPLLLLLLLWFEKFKTETRLLKSSQKTERKERGGNPVLDAVQGLGSWKGSSFRARQLSWVLRITPNYFLTFSRKFHLPKTLPLSVFSLSVNNPPAESIRKLLQWSDILEIMLLISRKVTAPCNHLLVDVLHGTWRAADRKGDTRPLSAQAGSSPGTSGTLRGAGDELHLSSPRRTVNGGLQETGCHGGKAEERPNAGPRAGGDPRGHAEQSVCCTPRAGEGLPSGCSLPPGRIILEGGHRRLSSDKQMMTREELSYSFWWRIPEDLIQQQTDLQCSDFNRFKSKY